MATAFVVVVCAGAWVVWHRRPASAGVRLIEPRLSGGIEWRPLAPPNDIRRRHVVANSAFRGTDVPDAESLAQLLASRPQSATSRLSAIASTSRDAATWNDLGAAAFAAGDLSSALAAVDQALLFDARYEESLFNRALILERFHLRDPAIAAWRDFLAHANNDGWRDEAKDHLSRLEVPLRTFSTEIETHYPRLQHGDRAAARALLELDAGDARYFGETDGLARWGEAWLRGDLTAANRHLVAMRSLATELRTFNGEALLADSLAAIERAGTRQRDALARGHIGVRDGRFALMHARKATDAEKILTEATRELESGGSPLGREARVYAATARFWRGRHAEAEADYRAILPLIPREHIALQGNIEWQLATADIARADTGSALTHLTRAIDIFTRLGERENAAYLHDIVSQVYDGARDHQRAAAHRELALRGLGGTPTYRLAHTIHGMVYDALQRKEWRMARSFLNVQIAVNAKVNDPELHTTALLRRARVHAQLGYDAAVDEDLRAAARVVSGVADAPLREKLQNDCDAATALVSHDPHVAIRLLTDALRYHSERGWRRLMPELHLRRGRMHRALNDHPSAAADFESGIALLEKHRETIAKGEQRWGILDAAEELFDEAITEALGRGPEAAFGYTERKRARSLSDDLADRFDAARLPRETLLIEYASLPDALLIFTVDDGGFDVRRVNVKRSEIAALASRFLDDPRAAQELRQHLLAPVWTKIAAHREIAFITDATTAGVPFAALPGNAGRYFVEDFTIAVAPSARRFLAARLRTPRTRTRALIVDNPDNDTLERLASTAREAQAVQSVYRDQRRLSGSAATRAAFIAESEHADVIHFAGHGVTDAESAAILLGSTASDSGRVDARAISRFNLRETDVVVLAACDTARGPVRAAEGVLSVTHAFLQAGVPSVVATLWPVDDREAAEFFPRLHDHLARGVPTPEAVRLTQLEFIRRSPSDRTATWAAVQAVGY